MKKVLYFLTAAAVAVAMAACQKPATNGNDDEGGKTPAAEAPTADFEFAVDGLKVTFTNKSTNATAYKWDFGDEETSKEASPEHIYATGGTYTVKLTAANAKNETAVKEASVTVKTPAQAYFTYEAQTDRAGKFGLTINFDASASVNAKTISWDFGDGSEASTEFKPAHTFPNYGKYTVKASVVSEEGAEDTYEEEVDVIGYNELLKGGSMEEDDAQYWETWSTEVQSPWAEGANPIPGLLSWEPTFGYTEDGPSGGSEGCLRLSSDNQDHDQPNNARFWQAIEVEEGDYLELSAQMKWGENCNDCGLLWFGIAESKDDIGADGTSVVEMFNYWNSRYHNPEAEAVPAFDGGFEANESYIAKNEELGLGYTNDGQPVAHYWVQKTGTAYFYVDLRSVNGYWHGPGHYYYFDNLSVKVVPAPAEE